LKLLVDNNLSPRIARCLQALFQDEHQVIAKRDKFPENTTDVDWITALDEEGGWAVITADLHIRTRPHERAALDRSNIVFFFLASAGANILSRKRRCGSFGSCRRSPHRRHSPLVAASNCRSTRNRSCGLTGTEIRE
jgi:PIN like domain